jgi:riboflavin kinase
VKIDGTYGAIVIPNRKNYPDNIIEVMAPVNLREHLRVDDESKVEVVLCRT